MVALRAIGKAPSRPSRILRVLCVPNSLRRAGWSQLHRIEAVAILERLCVDLFEFDLARQHLLLPFLLLGDTDVEFRHDFAREQFEALADVLVRVLAGLV